MKRDNLDGNQLGNPAPAEGVQRVLVAVQSNRDREYGVCIHHSSTPPMMILCFTYCENPVLLGWGYYENFLWWSQFHGITKNIFQMPSTLNHTH